MDPINVGSIIVGLIAAVSAYASQRAASKASIVNTTVESRIQMENEAYERARAFDTETIRRQDEEIKELRGIIKHLEQKVRSLRVHLSRARRGLPVNLEETDSGQLDDTDSDEQTL